MFFFVANTICACVIDSSVARCTWKESCGTSIDEDVVELLQTQVNMHRFIPHDEQIPPILFVKTHKTGGSTIVNILHRLGDAQSKEFLLPCNDLDPGHLGWPSKFPGEECNQLGVRPENQFDIICNHAVYNRTTMLAFLKKAKPAFVFTILREPVSQMQSAFNYLANPVGMISQASHHWKEPTTEGTQLVQQLVEQERAADELVWDKRIDFLKKLKTHPDKFSLATRARFLNPQSFDLGWYEAHDENHLPSDEDIQKWVEGLDFSYVMLTDMFDESLVRLSQKLHLMLEDVSNLHMKQKSYPHVEPSAKQLLELQDLFHVDFKLFAYYKRKFVQEWERHGNSTALQKLRELNDHISKACVQSSQVDGHSTYEADCTWAMRSDNKVFTKYLKEKQSKLMRP